MSTELVAATPLPLAVDGNDEPFFPAGATAWAVRKKTKGRPAAIRDTQGNEVYLPLDATRRDVRNAVQNVPGQYVLVAVDDTRASLGYPQAIIEFIGNDNGQWSTPEFGCEMPARMFDMFEQILENQKASMLACNDVVRMLTASIVDQQRASAELLRAAEKTIKVSSGLDALERQMPAPQVDVDSLASALAEYLEPDEEAPEPEGKLDKFLRSPMSGMLTNLVTGITQPLLALHQAKMKTALAETQASAPAATAQASPAGPAAPGTAAQPERAQPAGPAAKRTAQPEVSQPAQPAPGPAQAEQAQPSEPEAESEHSEPSEPECEHSEPSEHEHAEPSELEDADADDVAEFDDDDDEFDGDCFDDSDDLDDRADLDEPEMAGDPGNGSSVRSSLAPVTMRHPAPGLGSSRDMHASPRHTRPGPGEPESNDDHDAPDDR